VGYYAGVTALPASSCPRRAAHRQQLRSGVVVA
jgi:hypothetical protein